MPTPTHTLTRACRDAPASLTSAKTTARLTDGTALDRQIQLG